MTIRDRIKELRRVKASDLKPNPRNWREHPEAQRVALQGVLAEVGYADACLARELEDGSLELVDGHLRKDLDPDQELPVLVLDLDEAEAAKLLTVLDPLAGMAEANEEALTSLLAEIETESTGLKEMLKGLADDYGIEMEPGGEIDEVEPQIDRAAELQEKWGTELGQLWVIPSKTVKGGEHRLLCGDSTKAEDVERVMGGRRAGAVLTDPPYGIGQPGVPGDAPEDLMDLINSAVPLLPVDNAAVVAFQSTRTFPCWLDATRQAGFCFERILTLYKEAQCTYPWRGWILTSESILVSSIGTPDWQDAKPYAHDTYKISELSERTSGRVDGWHGSIKPLPVVRDIASRVTSPGGLVFDPFLGSGTTMVAAEQLGRLCYGIEIEPKYVAVILERMKDLGLAPRLKH